MERLGSEVCETEKRKSEGMSVKEPLDFLSITLTGSSINVAGREVTREQFLSNNKMGHDVLWDWM